MARQSEAEARDRVYLHRAMELALQAEAEGNLPIGAVIVLDGRIIAEGRNAIWSPLPAATRHAEMEALWSVDPALWPRAGEMTLYTTLEPCLMCAGAIMLHRIGRLVFGAADPYGGIGEGLAHGPPYFQKTHAAMCWEGPALPTECGALLARVLALLTKRPAELPAGGEGLYGGPPSPA